MPSGRVSYLEDKKAAVERLKLKPLTEGEFFSLYKGRENRLVVMPADSYLKRRDEELAVKVATPEMVKAILYT